MVCRSFRLICWLENPDELNETRKQFENLVESICLISSSEELIDLVNSSIDEKLFIILSSTFVKNVTSTINGGKTNIDSIYVYSSLDDNEVLPEIQHFKGLFDTFLPIFEAFRRDFRRAAVDSVEILVQSVDVEFNQMILLRNIVRKEQPSPDRLDQFLNLARKIYAENQTKLGEIENFDKKMCSMDFFLGENFVSAVMEKSFREKNLKVFRDAEFFIRSFNREITKLHREATGEEKRNAFLGRSVEETVFEKIRGNSQGKLLFGDFLRASSDVETATASAKQTLGQVNSVSVLFRIEILRERSSTPTVFIRDQETFVFSFASTFEIKKIEQIEEKFFAVDLTLIDLPEPNLFKVFQNLPMEIPQSSKQNENWKYLCKILIENQFFNTRTEVVKLYRELAKVYQREGNLKMALEYYKKQLLYADRLPLDELSLSYFSVAEIYEKTQDYSRAKEFHQLASNSNRPDGHYYEKILEKLQKMSKRLGDTNQTADEQHHS